MCIQPALFPVVRSAYAPSGRFRHLLASISSSSTPLAPLTRLCLQFSEVCGPLLCVEGTPCSHACCMKILAPDWLLPPALPDSACDWSRRADLNPAICSYRAVKTSIYIRQARYVSHSASNCLTDKMCLIELTRSLQIHLMRERVDIAAGVRVLEHGKPRPQHLAISS